MCSVRCGTVSERNSAACRAWSQCDVCAMPERAVCCYCRQHCVRRVRCENVDCRFVWPDGLCGGAYAIANTVADAFADAVTDCCADIGADCESDCGSDTGTNADVFAWRAAWQQ